MCNETISFALDGVTRMVEKHKMGWISRTGVALFAAILLYFVSYFPA